MKVWHLAKRFARASWPRPPADADEAWAATVLEPNELLLFRRLPDHDRRHAIRVARRVARELDPEVTSEPWVGAALLHDVGKYDAGLSVPGRALATVAAAAAGPARLERWAVGRSQARRRVALYARHGELGAIEIRRAGGRELTAAWCGAHHHAEVWSTLPIPRDVVAVLDAADNE